MVHKYKYLIIGGGVAGVTAAETVREKDKDGSVAIINDEPNLLYSRVMLSKPNFFLGKIPFEQIYLKGKDWYEKNNITFLGGKTAVDLSASDKIVSLEDGLKLQYEKLLLATGVEVRKADVPGADKKGIHYLRTLEDGKALMEHIKDAKEAVIVGGGFISFEMADLFRMAGLNTTLILRESYFWEPVLDEKSGEIVEEALTKGEVKILKKSEIAEILGNESVEGIILKDGTKIPCDILMFGIGVVSPINWLKKSGIAVNRGIVTNEYLETSLQDIWAAGDIAEYKDLLLEENVQMGNWVNAREQGRIAGMNMAGDRVPFKFISFYTTQGFGTSIAFVGDVSLGAGRFVISRCSPEINSYGRIIIDGKNELVGATLINGTSELTVLARLIENNVNVSTHRKELEDSEFDLKKF